MSFDTEVRLSKRPLQRTTYTLPLSKTPSVKHLAAGLISVSFFSQESQFDVKYINKHQTTTKNDDSDK